MLELNSGGSHDFEDFCRLRTSAFTNLSGFLCPTKLSYQNLKLRYNIVREKHQNITFTITFDCLWQNGFCNALSEVLTHILPCTVLNNCWLALHRGRAQANSSKFSLFIIQRILRATKGFQTKSSWSGSWLSMSQCGHYSQHGNSSSRRMCTWDNPMKVLNCWSISIRLFAT